MINMMDRWLKDYALLSRKYFPDVNESLSGAGAAGGLGFAFLTFLHASLESGIKIVLDETKLRDYVQNADIVVTGEGRLDGQTVMGKAPIGVAKIAKEYGKPVIAFSGCVTKDAIACNEHGIDAFFPVLRSVSTLDEAMCRTNAMQNIDGYCRAGISPDTNILPLNILLSRIAVCCKLFCIKSKKRRICRIGKSFFFISHLLCIYANGFPVSIS